MKLHYLYLLHGFLLMGIATSVFAQGSMNLYSDAENYISGSWTGNSNFTETNDFAAPDGSYILDFDYSLSGWWAGAGLNLTNWGEHEYLDLTGYHTMYVTYKGLTSGHSCGFGFTDNTNTTSSQQTVSSSGGYTTVALPMSGFSGANLSQVYEMRVQFYTGSSTGTGSIQIDKIELVRNAVGTPPTVSITAPSNGATITDNYFTITANANDADGSIAQLEYYVNDFLVSYDEVEPFSFTYFPQKNGNYDIRAVAIDNSGNEVSSSTISITEDYSGSFNAFSRARGTTINKGVSAGNWLESYWNIPWMPQWPEDYEYTFQQLQTLDTLGISTIRLPVLFERISDLSAPYDLNESHEMYDWVDSVIAWTDSLDMNLILCNHHGWGLPTATGTDEVARLAGMWKQIVQKYEHIDPDRLFFELKNEPTGEITNFELRKVFQSIVDSIRTINTTHTLVIGANNYNQGYALARYPVYNDTNTIYTWHDYSPFNFTHQGFDWSGYPGATSFASVSGQMSNVFAQIFAVDQWADTNNAYVFLGEFGVSAYATEEDRCGYVSQMVDWTDSLDIDWMYWGWKADEGGDNQFMWFNDSTSVTTSTISECMFNALDFDSSGFFPAPEGTPTPVSWLGFEAYPMNEDVALDWATAIEIDNDYFEVLKSYNGTNWNVIGQVDAAGYSTTYNHYNFIDKKPGTVNYYRIRQVDYNGSSSMTAIEIVTFETEDTHIVLYPNPSKDIFYLKGDNLNSLNVEVRNDLGQLLDVRPNDGQLDLSGYPNGTYMLRVNNQMFKLLKM